MTPSLFITFLHGVLQAKPVTPLMFIEHEPQIAERHERRKLIEPSTSAKAEVDGSISFRRSCRSAICGSCSMNINGVTGLACKTPCKNVMNKEGVIQIDPMPNFQPMKDLVV